MSVNNYQGIGSLNGANQNANSSIQTTDSYLLNEDQSQYIANVQSSMTVSASMSMSMSAPLQVSAPLSQASSSSPPTKMSSYYSPYFSASQIAEMEQLASAGQWDGVKKIIYDRMYDLLLNGGVDGKDIVDNKLRPLYQMSESDFNQALFLGTGISTTPTNPAQSNSPFVNTTGTFPNYQQTPNDSIITIITGQRKNIINELLNSANFTKVYIKNKINAYYAPFITDENDIKDLSKLAEANPPDDVQIKNKIKSIIENNYTTATTQGGNSSLIEKANKLKPLLNSANTFDDLFIPETTGFLLFDEQKWKDARDRLNKWNNLTAVLAKLVQSKGDGHNIVSQEMLSISGYTQMNIDQTVSKENEIFNKFADKKLSENLDAINNHNEKLSNDLKRIAKEEELNDPMTEFWTNLGGSLIAIVAAIFGGALSLGAAAIVASSSISAGASVAIQKFTSEDDIKYQKRIAEIENKLADVREAQAQQNKEQAQVIQNKKNDFNQMMQVRDQTGMITAMALSLGIDIAMDGMNLEEVTTSTANGYQEIARAKVLKIQEKVRQLQSLMNHLKNLNQNRRKNRNLVHQEMTGSEGSKSSESFEQAFQTEVNQKLQLLSRKQQLVEQSVNTYNQARRAMEQAKKAEKSLEGRLMGSLVSGFLGGLVPIGGIAVAAASGVSGGVLNYEATLNAENSEKKFDPGQIDWSTAAQSGFTQADFDLDALLQKKQQQIGNQINLDVQSLLIQSMLDGTQTKNMALNISQDRQMFNGMAASAVQQKMEILNRLQNAFLALKEQTMQSRGSIHSEMSDVVSEKSLTSTKAIYRSEYDFYLQNLGQKTAQIQEKINASNQKVTDQTNIDKARFGIFTSSVSGLFSGLGQGLTENSTTALRGILGATEVAVSGLSDDLYDLSLSNSDQNIGKGGFSDYKHASYENYQQIKNLNHTLDQMLEDLDPAHFEQLVVTDGAGRKAVDEEKLMKKILKISQENILNRAVTNLHKAKIDLRNMVHAEMTSHRGKSAGTLSDETIASEKKLAGECLRRAGEQLQEIASLETRKADAVQNFNNQVIRHSLTASTLALGSFTNSVSSLFYFQTASDLVGAGTDATFAVKELEETELKEKLNDHETIQKIIDKNQTNNQDKALSRLEKLEAELTLKILNLKAKEGDFGVSAINSASVAYARRMVDKIDNLKELYIRLRKEKAQTRALIKPGSVLNGAASEIAKEVNDYIKEIQQFLNNQHNTASQQQNSRASRMYQKLSAVSNSTSQGLFSLGGSLNNQNALNFSNTQQLLRNLSALRGSLHLSNQFLIKDYVAHQNKQNGIDEVDSDLAMNASDQLAVDAKKEETETALTQNALSLNGQISAMVFGAIFPLSSLLHETMNENQLINHYSRALSEKRLSALRAQQNQLKQKTNSDQSTLQNLLTQLMAAAQAQQAFLLPEIKTALEDLKNQKTENILKLSKTLSQINPNHFGTDGKNIISALTAASGEYPKNLQALNQVDSQIEKAQHQVDRDLAHLRKALNEYPRLSGNLNHLISQMENLPMEMQTLSHPVVKQYLRAKKEIILQQNTIARLTNEIMGPELENFLRDEDKRIQGGLQNYSRLAILLQAVQETEQVSASALKINKLNEEMSLDLIRLKNIQLAKAKLSDIEILARAGELIEDQKTMQAQVVRKVLDAEAVLQLTDQYRQHPPQDYQELKKRLEKLYAGFSYMSQGYAQISHNFYEKGKLNQLEKEYLELKKAAPVQPAQKLALHRARTRYLIEKSKQLSKGDAAAAYEAYQNYFLKTKNAQDTAKAEKALNLALNQLESEL